MSSGGDRNEETVAQSILDRLRRGDTPSESEALDWNRTPTINHLRSLVEPTDLSWILSAVENDRGDRVSLYISLLARHSKVPRVQSALQRTWGHATPFIKSVLLWRLLDDPDLSDDWHRKLFEFVLCEWGAFQDHSRRFFGGTEELVIAMCLERLHSSSTVESKKWAYLCCAANVREFPNAATAIVRLGLSSENEFNREVAGALLEKRRSN